MGSKRGNPRPAAGEDIRTYSVDQLLERMSNPFCSKEQMCRELERRARVLDGEQGEDEIR
jgi:hypothetical protein